MRQHNLERVVGKQSPRTRLQPIAPTRRVGPETREFEPLVLAGGLALLVVPEAGERKRVGVRGWGKVDVVGVDADVGARWELGAVGELDRGSELAVERDWVDGWKVSETLSSTFPLFVFCGGGKKS